MYATIPFALFFLVLSVCSMRWEKKFEAIYFGRRLMLLHMHI